MPQSAHGYSLRTVTSLRPVREFALDPTEAVTTSIDFSDSGSHLLAASNNETMQVIDCAAGAQENVLPSKKYGCTLARFTHNDRFCIYASTKGEDSIRYLSIEEKKFVRYFTGHKNKVTSLEMSPTNTTFISCSLDRSVRIWDSRSPHCAGKLSVPSPAFATYDSMGVVFAVASHFEKTIALYDARNFDKAAFKRISAHHVEGSWSKLEFSNDSKLLALSSDGSAHGLFDAMNGEPRGLVTGFAPLKRGLPSTAPTAFTPDGRYFVAGSNDQRLAIWDMEPCHSGDFHSVYTPVHETQVHKKPALVMFSPRTYLMASADRGTELWVPQKYEID